MAGRKKIRQYNYTMDNMPGNRDVSFIVVTYNSRSTVNETLNSILDSGSDASQVWVVDNGSSDETVTHIIDRYPGINVVGGSQNLGFSKANNLGVRESESEIVLFVNPDAVFLPGALDALVRELRIRRTTGICGPLILDRYLRPKPESYLLPAGLLGIFLLYSWLWRPLYRARSFGDRLLKPVRPRRRVALSWACLAVRREDFLRVGGFDEDLFMYFEDVDLCERISRVGLEVVQVPGAKVIHLGGGTYTGSRAVFFNSLRSMDAVLVKNSGPKALLAKRLMVMAGLALRWAAFWLLWRAGSKKYEDLPVRLKEGLRPFLSPRLLASEPLSFPS